MNKFLDSNLFAVIMLLLLAAVGILLLNYAFQSTMDRIEWQETTYQVQAGDSLWAISGDYCPENVDRREWIDEIQMLNGLDDSIIHPGQELIVLEPVKGGKA